MFTALSPPGLFSQIKPYYVHSSLFESFFFPLGFLESGKYLVKGYAVNEYIRKEQISELRQLVQVVGRTISNQDLHRVTIRRPHEVADLNQY